MASNVSELAKDLVSIPSPSGAEKAIGEFVADRLSKRFDVKKQYVAPNRFNVFATKGSPKIILNIHLDTVPGALKIRINKGKLYGRGAVDAKGPLAALIVAAEKAVDEGLTDFGLVLDVGEETNFCGIKKALKKIDAPELVIIAEPTDMALQIGQKGLLGFKVVSRGRSAHGARPENGICAITNLINALKKLRAIPYSEASGFGKTTINIGLIKGGQAINMIPDYAEATVEYRTVPGDEKLFGRIKGLLESNYLKVELLCDYKPYYLDDVQLVENLKKLLGKINVAPKIVVKPEFTEMYFWSKKGKTVVIGPGDDSTEHSDNENVSLNDLESGAEFYLELLRKFCKRGKK